MKVKTLCKVLSLVLVFALLLSALVGCGNSTEKKDTTTSQVTNDATKPAETKANPDEPGWKQDTKPITFDWYIHFSWFATKWENSIVSKYVTEKTGVKINFIVPSGNENEKLNTLIASGSLPDFVTLGWSEGLAKTIQESGLVLPLNKLADQYDPAFYKVAAKTSLGWYTNADGNVYGYPNFSMAPEKVKPTTKLESNQTFLVRKDMYEALGKPDMRTPEGFLNALKAAKEKFPQVNGQPIIPLGCHEFTDSGNDSFESYIKNFLSIPREQDGKLYDTDTHPEYARWMKTLRKANEMGLISKDIFVDKRAQMEEKMAQGRYFSMLYQRTDMASQQLALYKKDPNTVYIAIDGPSNEKLEPNKPGMAGGIAGWTITHISKSNKDPKRAIQFMTYMLSEEGQKDFYLGKKGDMWDTIDGKDQMLKEVDDLRNSDRKAYDEKYGGDATYWMLSDSLTTDQWKPAVRDPIKQMVEWTWGKTVSYAAYDDLDPATDSDEGIILKKVKDARGLLLPKLILAKSDAEFDKLFSDFQTLKQQVGYDKVLAYQQKKLEAHKKIIGVK